MAASKNPAELTTAVRDDVANVVVTAAVALADRQIFVEASIVSGNYLIQLPSVSAMKGKTVTVHAVTVSAGNIYVVAKGESSSGGADGDDALMPSIDLDTTNDFVVLYSDGSRWYLTASEKA